MVFLDKSDSKRLKEIKNASIEAFDLNLPKGFESAVLLEHQKDLRTAFALGAQWADAHPYVPLVIELDEIDDVNIVEE